MKRLCIIPFVFLFCISCKHVKTVVSNGNENNAFDSLATAQTDSVMEVPEKPTDGIAVTFPWRPGNYPVVGTYTVTVTYAPCCCILQEPLYGSLPPGFVWIEGPSAIPGWGISGYPWQIGCLIPATDPYECWHVADLFDTIDHTKAAVGIDATRSKEISTLPPPEVPEPAKPARLPLQPWHEAILPSHLRIRKA